MNYMEQVAKMLGVEIGEEFKVKYDDLMLSPKYCFLEDGLHYDSGCICRDYSALFKLLNGAAKIIKFPWKPEFGDFYFTPGFHDDELYISNYWEDDDTDRNRYNRGLVFKTKKEAIEKAQKMLDAIKD